MSSGVLLVSHGTVDRLEDLGAFVTNVRHGRAPDDALVAELRRRYQAIGGSPLDRINAELAGRLGERLGVAVLHASRFWRPSIEAQLGELLGQGVERVAVVPLAQHSAHVYEAAVRQAAAPMKGRPELVFAKDWGSHPALCAAFARRIDEALAIVGRSRASVLMTAHSLPRAVVERGDPYEREVRAAATDVARRVGDASWKLAFQSQGLSQSPGDWLGPDLATALDEIRAGGAEAVVFAPIGFLADHVEILYDLDVEAAEMARTRGLRHARARSLNADEELLDVLADVARPLLGHG